MSLKVGYTENREISLRNFLEPSVADSDVVCLVPESLDIHDLCSTDWSVDGSNGLSELQVVGNDLEKGIIIATLTWIQDEILTEEVIVAISVQANLLRLFASCPKKSHSQSPTIASATV